MKHRFLGVLFFLFCATPLWAAESITFPQIALGGGYDVVLLLSNPTNSYWHGGAALYQGDWGPWAGAWRVNGAVPTPGLGISIELAPLATKRYLLEGDNVTRSGFMCLTGMQDGPLSVSVQLFVEYRIAGKLQTFTVLPYGLPASLWRFPVFESAGSYTGWALVGEIPGPWPITIKLVQPTGQIEHEIIVPYQGQVARFLEEYFLIREGFIGFVEISTLQPVWLVALKQEDTTGGFQLSAIQPDHQ